MVELIQSKIFVSIACFMERDIVNTIEDCLENRYKIIKVKTKKSNLTK